MNYLNYTKRTIFVFAGFLILFSCSNSKKPLRLVFANKVNYESFIIANHNGYFNEKANNISIQTVNSGIQAAEAFTTGNADIIATGNGPAVILLSKNNKNRIVTRYATGEKMHRLIVDSALKNVSELIGKKIGVQQGSSTHAALVAWLQENNILLQTVTIVPMEPANMPEAMKNKQLDAIAASEPYALHVEKFCKSSVYELSNLYNKSNSQSHVLISTEEFTNEHKQQIKAVIEGLKRANDFIVNNPQKSAEIISKKLGLTVEEQILCTSRLSWSIGWEQKDQQSLEQTAQTLFQFKKLQKIPVIQELISTDFR